MFAHIVKDASGDHRLPVWLLVLVLGRHQLHQVGNLLPNHLRGLVDHLPVQAVELHEVIAETWYILFLQCINLVENILCQFFSGLVDIGEVSYWYFELSAEVLKHFVQAPQQLLFLSCRIKRWHWPMSLWLLHLPSQRSASVSSGRRQVQHGPGTNNITSNALRKHF